MRIVTFTSKIRKKKKCRNDFLYCEERGKKIQPDWHIPVWCFTARWHNPVLCCQLIHIKRKTKELTTTATLKQGFAHHSPGSDSSDDLSYVLQAGVTFNLAAQTTTDCRTVAPPTWNKCTSCPPEARTVRHRDYQDSPAAQGSPVLTAPTRWAVNHASHLSGMGRAAAKAPRPLYALCSLFMHSQEM